MKICKNCLKNLWRGNKTGYCVQCLGKTRCGINNPFGGKTHSKKTKEKMSGPRPSIFGEKNPHYGKKHSEETKKIISEKAKKRLKDRPELLEQLRLNRVKSSSNSFRITKPQRLTQKYLEEHDTHYKINGIIERYSFDFILKDLKIIIEVQGTYWHADPRKYGEGKIPLNERQIYKVSQDIIKKRVAEEYGYKMIYIWEDDIKQNNFSIIEDMGVILRGGGVDESPHVYRRLPSVLETQGDSIQIVETLHPLIVCMADKNTKDPYKD